MVAIVHSPFQKIELDHKIACNGNWSGGRKRWAEELNNDKDRNGFDISLLSLSPATEPET
jgi:hypothetical protein